MVVLLELVFGVCHSAVGFGRGGGGHNISRNAVGIGCWWRWWTEVLVDVVGGDGSEGEGAPGEGRVPN